MNFREEFNLSIRARCAVLYVTTREEERLLSVVKDCAAELENMRVVSWDFASGFDVGVAVGKGNPIAVLDFIAKEPADTPILYVLKDFHRFLEDNMVCRMVKNLAVQLKPQQKSILIVSPVYKVPEELTSSVSVLEFQLPTLPELREYITNITQNVVVDMDKEGFEQFVRAFQGLTISTVKTILSKALARSGKISLNDLQLVLEEKKQVIRKTQVLEFFNAEETMGSIGGMDTLKSWIITRGMAFSEQAQQFGLPYPKGVLIVGIQGTGKSLCAKAISQQWHMPLLRLDVGRLMGSYVGESEARTREMIQIAEAMAPCVLWIDEVDKGFAGIGGVQGDSGAQARVFGSLITWMQEKKSPVFIVATANNIEQLPPEFMRKGRFDEIFFVNLPTEKERVEIFRLHISRRRDIAVKNYDLAALAKETKGFSGAEIEQVINDAMFQAFSQQRDFTTEDILAAIHSTIPLSVSFRETINKLIAWAGSGRARMASSQQEANESAAGDQLYYSYQNGTGDGIQ